MRGFFYAFIVYKNNYRSMRIISDELFDKLVKILSKDEKVAAYIALILSQKAEPKNDEVKK